VHECCWFPHPTEHLRVYSWVSFYAPFSLVNHASTSLLKPFPGHIALSLSSTDAYSVPLPAASPWFGARVHFFLPYLSSPTLSRWLKATAWPCPPPLLSSYRRCGSPVPPFIMRLTAKLLTPASPYRRCSPSCLEIRWAYLSTQSFSPNTAIMPLQPNVSINLSPVVPSFHGTTSSLVAELTSPLFQRFTDLPDLDMIMPFFVKITKRSHFRAFRVSSLLHFLPSRPQHFFTYDG